MFSYLKSCLLHKNSDNSEYLKIEKHMLKDPDSSGDYVTTAPYLDICEQLEQSVFDSNN